MRFYRHWQPSPNNGLRVDVAEARFQRDHYAAREARTTFEALLNELASMPKFKQVTDEQVEETRAELKAGTINPGEVLRDVFERLSKSPSTSSTSSSVEVVKDLTNGEATSSEEDNSDEKPDPGDGQKKDKKLTYDTDVPVSDPTYPFGSDVVNDQFFDMMMRCDDYEWQQDHEEGQREVDPTPNASVELAYILQAISLLRRDLEKEEKKPK